VNLSIIRRDFLKANAGLTIALSMMPFRKTIAGSGNGKGFSPQCMAPDNAG